MSIPLSVLDLCLFHGVTCRGVLKSLPLSLCVFVFEWSYRRVFVQLHRSEQIITFMGKVPIQLSENIIYELGTIPDKELNMFRGSWLGQQTIDWTSTRT